MSRERSWKNVKGKFVRELGVEGGQAFDDGSELPAELSSLLLPFLVSDGELVIEFTSSGYYDPGSMYGGWQNLGSPPEGEDERLLSVAYLELDNPNGYQDRVELPNDVQQKLFDHYLDRIEAAELDD